MNYFKRIFLALFLSLSLSLTQSAYAFSGPLPIDWNFQRFMVTVVGTAGASGAVTAATAAGGTFLGLTPVGWVGAGLVVVASVLMTGDTAVVVATDKVTNEPNPDINANAGTYTPPTTYAYIPVVGGVAHPYVYATNPTNNIYQFNFANQSTIERIATRSRLISLISAYGLTIKNVAGTSYDTSMGSYADSTGGTSYCAAAGGWCWWIYYSVATTSGATLTTGTVPAGLTSKYIMATTTNGISYNIYALYIPFKFSPQGGMGCTSDTSYDYLAGVCVDPVTDQTYKTDKVCRVSWSENGCPIYNRDDPDCTSANIQKSCGSTTVPPSVVITDPVTGANQTVQRPTVATQGTPGATAITQNTPNPTTGNTDSSKLVLAPAPITSTNPVATPVGAGTTTSVYQGTGTQTSATPSATVSVLNWPSVVNVTGTVTCTNCTTSAPSPAASAVTVNFPDKIKIDDEGHTEQLSDPTAPTEPTDLFDGLTAKFKPILSFQFPPHTSQCVGPSHNLASSGFTTSISSDNHTSQIDATSTVGTVDDSGVLCDTLEKFKTLFQSICLLTTAWVCFFLIIP